jgi:hypothetical protein
MNSQSIIDTLVTIFVLLAVFFLAYCAIRRQGLSETWDEIQEIIHGKATELGETKVYG